MPRPDSQTASVRRVQRPPSDARREGSRPAAASARQTASHAPAGRPGGACRCSVGAPPMHRSARRCAAPMRASAAPGRPLGHDRQADAHPRHAADGIEAGQPHAQLERSGRLWRRAGRDAPATRCPRRARPARARSRPPKPCGDGAARAGWSRRPITTSRSSANGWISSSPRSTVSATMPASASPPATAATISWLGRSSSSTSIIGIGGQVLRQRLGQEFGCGGGVRQAGAHAPAVLARSWRGRRACARAAGSTARA